MLRRFSSSAICQDAAQAAAKSVIPPIRPQLPIHGQRYAISKHNKKIRKLRKEYLEEFKSAQSESKKAEGSLSKAAIEKEEQDIMSDPLIVGSYLPRRELKRERVRRFGELPRIPLPGKQGITDSAAQPHGIPPLKPQSYLPRNELPKYEFEATQQLKDIFARDLQPDNPRLMHLLYLWHSTEEFVTPSNMEDKLDAFFAHSIPPTTVTESLLAKPDRDALKDPMSGDSVGLRLHRIAECGIVDHPEYKEVFNVGDFAETDRQFVKDQASRSSLYMGSIGAHMSLREQVVRDKITGSLFGKPGVAKVLEWGAADQPSPKSPEQSPTLASKNETAVSK